MAVLNQTVRRFESGGQFLIGTDTVANINEGTLKIIPSIREALEWHDRDVPQIPLEGKRSYGEIELEVKAGKFAATELFTALRAQASPASNLVKTFPLTIKIPANAAASTGEQFTCSYAFLTPDGMSYQAGTQFDTVRIKLRTQDDVVATTY